MEMRLIITCLCIRKKLSGDESNEEKLRLRQSASHDSC